MKDIVEFFREETKEYWVNKGVLVPKGDATLLQGKSCKFLLEEMRMRKISKLTFGNEWFIDSTTGTFCNKQSREMLQGEYSKLKDLGNIFRRMNKFINPYYQMDKIEKPQEIPFNIKQRLIQIHGQIKRMESDIVQLIELVDCK